MSIEIDINLYEDWIAGNIEELQTAINEGYYFKDHKEWQTKILAGEIIEKASDRERLLIINLERKLRRITPQPRTLFVCNTLSVPPARLQGWSDFCSEVKNGKDLNRRLSRQSLALDCRDEMLNHWGLQHFHIGVGPDPKYPSLVKGESEIVYAYVTPKAVYAIDIAEHGKWADIELLETLDLEFPKALDAYKTDALDLSWEASAEEHKHLRKANLNMMLKVNGKILVEPGMGVMCDGTPSRIVFPMIQTRRRLRCADKVIRDNLDAILCDVLKTANVTIPQKLTFILLGFTSLEVFVLCHELSVNIIVHLDGTWIVENQVKYKEGM